MRIRSNLFSDIVEIEWVEIGYCIGGGIRKRAKC